jgi:hypothetical protein
MHLPIAVFGRPEGDVAVVIERVATGHIFDLDGYVFRPEGEVRSPFIELKYGGADSLFEGVARVFVALDDFDDGRYILWFFDRSVADRHHCFDSKEIDVYAGDYRSPNPKDVARRLLHSTVGGHALKVLLEELHAEVCCNKKTPPDGGVDGSDQE